MNEKEGLNLLDFLPTGMGKSDPVLQAVFSNDAGEGALANEVEALLEFIRYYTETDTVKNHRGYTLELITRLFAKVSRQLAEDDERLLRRMCALTERRGDTVWGTATDIEHVFETYFAGIKAYVCEHTSADTLLVNGDFEAEEGWELTGSAGYTDAARFSGKRGLFFDGTPGAGAQRMERVSPAVYTLHFFLLGHCGVIIQDRQGRYWDATAEPNHYRLRWQDEAVINYFASADWNDVYCFVVLPEATAVTITFVSVAGKEGSIDYARFFLKPRNPSYTIVIQYEGFKLSERTLHLGPGTVDPIEGVNYRKESYFDHAYIIGRQGAYKEEVYKGILDIVRPRGIQALVEFVEKTALETA
jgi:hypothetical protein